MDRVNDPPGLGSIRFLTGSAAGSTFPIMKPIVTIVREPGNDIVVSDSSVSRRHAQISLNNGTWTITKLASQNTLTVNQRDVQQSPINDRDMIGLGGTTFLFQRNAGVPGIPYVPTANAQASFQGVPSAAVPQQSFQAPPP